MIAGAFVAGRLILSRRMGLLATLVLAFGRVYVGVHHPADTTVGLLGGAAIAAIVALGLQETVTTLARQLTDTPSRGLIITSPATPALAPSTTDVSDPARRR